jgi:2,4-dichlorophenol 6-monooxygenase
MNQRYKSPAVMTDGQMEPAFELDAELHYQPTTWPGARLPHVWVFDRHGERFRRSIFPGGQFTILTGIGGEAWAGCCRKGQCRFRHADPCPCDRAASAICRPHGDWARAREIGEGGASWCARTSTCAWRAEEMVGDPEGELRRVLTHVLGHTKSASMAAE